MVYLASKRPDEKKHPVSKYSSCSAWQLGLGIRLSPPRFVPGEPGYGAYGCD
ncbi:MAG: hypothetical protein ABI472_16355 [Ginsengibacter sp.]